MKEVGTDGKKIETRNQKLEGRNWKAEMEVGEEKRDSSLRRPTLRRSEGERKNRPSPFGMTGRGVMEMVVPQDARKEMR